MRIDKKLYEAARLRGYLHCFRLVLGVQNLYEAFSTSLSYAKPNVAIFNIAIFIQFNPYSFNLISIFIQFNPYSFYLILIVIQFNPYSFNSIF